MKNKVWIMIAAAFVAIMILAAVLYPMLTEKYPNAGTPASTPDNTPDSTNSSTVVQADDFTVYDADMNEVKLSDSFGKPIIVNFWASWCGPCKSELPAFDNLYGKYKDDVVFLMVNLTDGQRETVSSVKEFISDSGYSFPVYYDIEYDAAIAYGVRSIPETVFIHADGSLYDIRVGAMNEAVLENYIEQMIGE